MSQPAPLSALLDLMDRLESAKIHYQLDHFHPREVMITASVPGERWEIDVMEDGTIAVEVFVSRNGVEAGETVEELFERFSD